MKPKWPKKNLQKQGRISTNFRGGGEIFLAGQNIYPCVEDKKMNEVWEEVGYRDATHLEKKFSYVFFYAPLTKLMTLDMFPNLHYCKNGRSMFGVRRMTSWLHPLFPRSAIGSFIPMLQGKSTQIQDYSGSFLPVIFFFFNSMMSGNILFLN